jgi:hypothetical protein
MKTILLFLSIVLVSTVAFAASEESSSTSSTTISNTAVPLVGAALDEAKAVCAQYSRCSECVYDSTSVVMNRRTIVACAWCPQTSTCAYDFGNTCPSNRTLTVNNQCEDMTCSAARVTGNIYLCRIGMMFALFLSIVLILLGGVYGLWYRVIQQAPWRYDNLESALRLLCDTHSGPWNASQKAPRPDILSADPAYQITKKEQKRSTYDEWAFGSTVEERFWTYVKRYAFFPLAISVIAGVLSTFLLFTASIRPYFADMYYALLLLSGYGSLGAMLTYVRLFQPTSASAAPQLWIDLAIFLRGRNIDKAFPVIANDASKAKPLPAAAQAVVAAASSPTPKITVTATSDKDAPEVVTKAASIPDLAANKLILEAAEKPPLTPLGIVENAIADDHATQTAAASSAFELDEGIPSDFRSKVQEIIKSDETVLWFEAPDRNVVGIEYNWMYSLFTVGLGFAVFLYVLSGAHPYPPLLLPPSSLIVIALMLIVVFFYLFVVLSSGCKRINVLTSKRLIVVARSVGGAFSVNQVSFEEISYCVLIGYREMNHFIMTLGWERIVANPPRRMPKIQTDAFIGVSKIDSLLRLLIPRLKNKALPATFHDDLVHLRYVWRVHTAINIASIFLSPVMIVYSHIFPGGYGVLAMLLVMFVNSTLLHRALRVLTTTVAPITVETDGAKTDAFSVTKALQQVTESFPMLIPELIRKAGKKQKSTQGENDSP